MAQFGGVPWAALAAGGCVGGLKVKVMVKGRRLRRALCNGGWGWAALSAGGRCLWPSSRIPRRCRRLTEAGRSGGVQPDHTLLATGLVRPDTTGPASLASVTSALVVYEMASG